MNDPKQQAKELVKLFSLQGIQTGGYALNQGWGVEVELDEDIQVAKKLALICVDDKINLLREIREEIGLDISHIERQEKLKSEIEKL